MLVESSALKNRKELFLKHVELLESSAQYMEISNTLGTMLGEAIDADNNSDVPSVQDINDGLHTMTIEYILGKITKEELSEKFKVKEDMNISYSAHEANSTLWLNGLYVEEGIGYPSLKWLDDKVTGYKGLREHYGLPLEGDIDTSSNLIEVEIKSL